MLKMVWISRTSATQRLGRAGRCRPGICYRLYSSARFAHFSEFQTPEILRTPLMELCLNTKLLAPANMPIADFLARSPQPPSFIVTRNAVQMLKTMEALDAWEDVTELGNHLLDLPIEPRLGKMLLHGVVLKCLDPILTIVCCLAYKYVVNHEVFYILICCISFVFTSIEIRLLYLSIPRQNDLPPVVAKTSQVVHFQTT